MTGEELLNCLVDRPCSACKYHKENGCSKWNCVFEEPIDEAENKGDLISRQAVIDLVSKFIVEIISEGGRDLNAHTNDVLRQIVRNISSDRVLPSVENKAESEDKE